MSQPSTSARTVLRDAAIAALEAIKTTDAARKKEFDISKSFLAIEECKRFPTYCVVVTDEAPEPMTQQHDDFGLTLTIVIYTKNDADPRAELDAAIEDVYEAILQIGPTIKETVWKLKLEDLTTDDGTTVAKPHAQALQRWSGHHRRRASA